MHILFIEDDIMLGQAVEIGLSQRGLVVDWLTDGDSGLKAMARQNYDLVLLDLGLPELGGMEVLKLARQRQITTPIIVLTARDSQEYVVQGLKLGADDYLRKPVDINELAARIQAVTRRIAGHASNILSDGDLTLDLNQHTVRFCDATVKVSPTEFRLLEVLMQTPGKLITRERLEQAMSSDIDGLSSNALEVHVHNLRRKMLPELIQVVRGVGYRLKASGDSES